jgi:predicted ATPase/class 3 adenylate cyclase
VGAGPGPPTGTVTFLFTDLEGSTEQWEERPAVMREAVAAHDGLLRSLISAHDGYVFTTAGDSFAVAFSEVERASAAAAEIQRGLAGIEIEGLRLSVRVGLHTGSAELRDGDYFGPDVNLAARVMSAAHGGQVLLSGSAAALSSEDTSSLGSHRLKGIARPVALFQLLADGLPTDFSPPRGAEAPSNLPAPTDALIGRDDEVAHAQMLLDTNRLLTLLGTGGAGKTRLALEIARERSHSGGIWFVDLSAIDDDSRVPATLAEAIGLRQTPGRPMADQVLAYLRGLDALLIVDNCEHIIDGAADFIAELLAGCPDCRVIATSREALEIPGEVVKTVGPLAVPVAGASPGAVLAAPAMCLLAERARAALPGEDPVAAHPADAANICRLVDGLPLALELAAARLRSLTMTELSERLGERLSILDARRGRRSRHRTLEAVVEWSYDLCSPEEQMVFEQLSVFVGGFSLAAAEEIVGGAGVARADVLDVLVHLCEKSLLNMVDETGRYRMLETLRAFSLDRIERRGDAKVDEVADRHLSWVLTEIEDLESAMRTDRQDSALAAIRPDHDNFRAARARAESLDDFVAALRITASAPVDPSDERHTILEDFLRRATDAPLDLRARASYTTAGSRFESGGYAEGIEFCEDAVRLFAEIGDRSQEAYAKMMMAFLMWGARNGDVESVLADSLRMFDDLDDTMGRAYTNWLQSQRRILGGVVHPGATEQAELAVSLFAHLDSPYGQAHAVEGLGNVHAASGDYPTGMLHLVDAAARLHRLGEMGCLAHALDAVAAVMVAGERFIDGARLVGLADRLRDDTGTSFRPWEREAYDACRARLNGAVDPDELAAATQAGRALDVEAVVSQLASSSHIASVE